MDKISTSSISRFKIYDSFRDTAGNKIPIIYGPLSFEETISHKGYRYRHGFWQKVLSNPAVKEAIDKHTMLGMIEHPEDDSEYLSTPYEKASHVVYGVELKKGTPYGKLALVNNQYGNSIKALVDLNVPIGVSTRALGNIVSDSESDYIDENDYALITWDFTRKPNLEEAMCSRLQDSTLVSSQFKELIGAYQLRDSSFEGYNKSSLKKDITSLLRELHSQIETVNSTYSKLESMINDY